MECYCHKVSIRSIHFNIELIFGRNRLFIDEGDVTWGLFWSPARLLVLPYYVIHCLDVALFIYSAVTEDLYNLKAFDLDHLNVL